jgi:D-3-phosphoglycerate dehydrogenase / 2-oxoglutarate reductase
MNAKNRPVVLLTNTIDPAGVVRLETAAEVRVASATDAETLKREARDASAIIVRALLPDDICEAAPSLRAIIRHGAGVDMIPIEAATQKRVYVANVPGVNAVKTAEFIVGQMLALAHRFPFIERRFRRDGWVQNVRDLGFSTTELAGKQVGIVGLGAIGSAIARMCGQGFGMKIAGFQRRLDQMPAGVTPMSLDELASTSDYIALACPLNDSTRGLWSANLVKRMKPSAYFVNAARGAIVDEAALIDALRSGGIAGAALDVYAKQPLAADSPLMTLENVLLTPHLAGIGAESMRAMSLGTADEALRVLRGEAPVNWVNRW